jgi:hypothetical protein
MIEPLTDYWGVRCDRYCGELEERHETEEEARKAAQEHLDQHTLILDAVVAIFQLRYLEELTKEAK